MDKKEELNPQTLEVQVPERLRPGAYANTTNISVTQNELVLNFIFANESDTPRGTLVARVVVSRKHAQQLMKTLQDAVTTAEELDPQS